MPIEINNKRCKELADNIERTILNSSTSYRSVETGVLDKEEAEEIKRILKESERGIFYECEIRVIINPTNLITAYKLIVKRK